MKSMKKWIGLSLVVVLCVALLGCKKKEDSAVENTDQSLKKDAANFKESADATAVEVGHTFKNLGKDIGSAFKKADKDMRNK